MAKNNNKGFSLIEVVIAVAILSILLGPIVKQFAQTLETSRKAKALQEVNEKAVSQLEEFKTYSLGTLEDKYGAPTVKTKKATLYDKSGNAIVTDMEYRVYEYSIAGTANPFVAGAKKDKYVNKVVLDDLANKVRDYGGKTAAEHYKVAYNLSDAEVAALSGFSKTNEGSLVKYDSEGYINAVVCTNENQDGSAVTYVQDPNTINLGNMQNMDKNTVALVMGDTSSFDSQAFVALFAKAMAHLRDLDYDSWEQALVNIDSESILSQDSMNRSKRLIKIYADKETDATTGKDSYVVKVDVYYDYNYTLSTDNNKSQTYHDTIHYNVFSQRFFTDEAPAIYFEYQPYAVSESDEDSTTVEYQKDDYILIDNHVDECKIYLYKPYLDQMNVSDGATISGYYSYDSNGDGTPDSKEPYYTYYTKTDKKQKVKIHLATKVENTGLYNLDKDGKCTNGKKRFFIFTNLDIAGFYDKDNENVEAANSQFTSDAYSGIFPYVKGEMETAQNVTEETAASYNKYATGNRYRTLTEGASEEKSQRILYALNEDLREADRLFTVTVYLDPIQDDGTKNVNLNEVKLSGAKGE